ncbi:unnamed protein product [Chironomus riparius]|uniref:Uncharacterized protein n=1 Tax=Chironomus riparius TaxID=315576 RepID=A0A9P0JAN3_9DIPT|nr:unnamed protein product [Chironomus riparius]
MNFITVINNDWTWHGFPHDIFNQICRNSKSLNHLVLIGAGTGSYFDSDEFPFKITKLETTMITFHWYIGIKSARVDFLKSQKGSLKELTIHELPYDFDGGKVLKYIIEELNLDTFYYGKIPLILNGQKQQVKEFTASEIQITSAFEMIQQFPSIKKFTLKISGTDKSKIIQDLIKNHKKKYIIPFGHTHTCFNEINIDELYNIVQNPSYDPIQPRIQYINLESGYFAVRLLDDPSVDIFKVRVRKASFRVLNDRIQYPIIVLPEEPRVHLSCTVAEEIEQNNFLTTVPFKNKMNPSRWIFESSTRNDDGRHEMMPGNNTDAE